MDAVGRTRKGKILFEMVKRKQPLKKETRLWKWYMFQ